MNNFPLILEKLLIRYWHKYKEAFPAYRMSEESAELYVERYKRDHAAKHSISSLLSEIKSIGISFTDEEIIELMPFTFGEDDEA